MHRLASVAALLGLMLLAGTALGAGVTRSHRFVAFTGGRLAIGLQAERQAKGHCWTGSIADPRSDAWRCFLGNEILDPCFSNGHSAKPYAVCPETPWKRKVIVLRLTQALPLGSGNSGPVASKDPWAIATSGGQRCLAVTGATGLIAGKPMRYYCQSGGSLVGEPNRHSATWTIFYAAKGSTHLNRVSVTDAWY